jgi:serine/threonine protein kinase
VPVLVILPNVQVETMIVKEVQDLPRGLERENRIIQTIMRQLLFALDGLHSTGIVHRDIKPQNIIFSEGNDIEISSNIKVKVNLRSNYSCFHVKLEQDLVHSKSLILEQQQICEWESIIFQRNFFWTQGTFFLTRQQQL